jgi:hypothetical protein
MVFQLLVPSSAQEPNVTFQTPGTNSSDAEEKKKGIFFFFLIRMSG